MEETDALITALVEDPGTADISPADGAMLEYAAQLTGAPPTITAETINRLRHVGFDDRAIHDICAVAAYYAFVNRIADGLGVELEERFTTGP